MVSSWCPLFQTSNRWYRHWKMVKVQIEQRASESVPKGLISCWCWRHSPKNGWTVRWLLIGQRQWSKHTTLNSTTVVSTGLKRGPVYHMIWTIPSCSFLVKTKNHVRHFMVLQLEKKTSFGPCLSDLGIPAQGSRLRIARTEAAAESSVAEERPAKRIKIETCSSEEVSKLANPCLI